MINTRQELEGILTRVQPFNNPKLELEQYITPPHVAATMLWTALLKNDLYDKIVLDLFAGTGMLSIGAAFLGAKKIIAIEYDHDAIIVFKNNLIQFQEESLPILIQQADVFQLHDIHADTVIMNPPFGVQGKRKDTYYLKKAFQFAPVIYSLFNYSPQNEAYLIKYGEKHGYTVEALGVMDLPIPRMHVFHKKNWALKKTILLRFKNRESN